MNSKLGFLALALVTACSAIACGGDDDVEPGGNSSGGLASSSSSGDVTSSSSSSSGSVTSSSSSGSVTSSSSGGSSGTVSLCPAAPTEYPGADTFATNAAAGLAIRGQLNALNAKMLAAEPATTPIVPATLEGEQGLTTLYNASGAPMVPSLFRLASASRKEVVAATLSSFVAVQGGTFSPRAETVVGGKSGKWIFDARGLDLRQMIEKGSFGAELFRGFSTQDPRPLTGRVDEIVALFGTNPTFPGVTPSPGAPTDAVHVAKYAFQRDATGLYADFKTNAIVAKHASAHIADCQAEFDGAISGMKKAWEETLAAATINYLHIASTAINSPTETVAVDSLHKIGEATGFLYGLASLPEADRIITDAALATIFEKLRIQPGAGEFSPIAFVTGAVDPVVPFNDSITALQTAYGFTDAQITTFKGN